MTPRLLTETDEPVTAQDAASLASFVDKLAVALHKHQKVLSIDLDSWRQEDNPFWKHQPLYNHSLLNATALDKAITMSTYERSYNDFVVFVGRMLEDYAPTAGTQTVQTHTADSYALRCASTHWALCAPQNTGTRP